MLCNECDKKQFCSTLCPEMEVHLRELEVNQRDKTIGLPRYGKWPELVSAVYLTRTEKNILKLEALGLSRRQIAELLHISKADLRNRISRIKAKNQ